jgi:TolB-like protein/DNA-binding SARP family transcriptional activator
MDAASALQNGTEGLAHWSLRLFGDVQLNERPGGEKVTLPGKRERVLLAYLALSPNCRQPRRKLVTLLWGEAADETSLDNLRTCVFNLRKALGDTGRNVIASEDRDIVLDSSAFEIDVLEFRRLAAQSGLVNLEEAAKLYSGEFLDGLAIESEEYESWRRAEAVRFKDQGIDVLTRLMAQLGEHGETERAIEAGSRILRLEPLHEGAARRLMRLYGESGRRGAAIQVYRTLAETLRTELNAQPEAETRAVFAELSRGGEERTQAPAAADAMRPPRSASMTSPSDAPGEPPPPAQHFAPVIGPRRQAKARKLSWILAGGLVAVIAIFLFYEFVLPAGTTTAQQQTSPAGTIAIAVLPFTNLSSDAEQEFFSDGMTEEITAVLAKIPGLQVVGRTSAYQFKGERKALRAIGQALNATHLIEGSVRKEDNRVRITAQLIQADNGVQVWTESYDRELTGVFAIQEDIAQAIAGALRVPLGLQQGESLVSNRTNNVDSYQDYLRARAIFRGRAQSRFTDAIALLEQVLARDPGFAPAWALLADGYDTMTFTAPAVYVDRAEETRRIMSESLRTKAEEAAQRAIQLDPTLPDGYVSLGSVQIRHGKLLLAEELVSKALALDPNHSDALASYSYLLLGVGRLKEALASSQKLRLLEPFAPEFNFYAVFPLWLNGQTDAAIALLDGQPPGSRARVLASIYASEGRYGEAASVLSETPSAFPPGTVETAIRLLRTVPASAPSPQTLPRLGGTLGFVYLRVGAPDRVLESYEEAVRREGLVMIGAAGVANLWHRSYAPVRKTERFKAFARSAGLVEYWRAKGWPDLCRPMGTGDFVCD